jgi:chromosome segregation ATPase
MKSVSVRIQELQKEIDNLVQLRDEAKSEWNQCSDEALYYAKKAKAAEKRMFDLNDEIEYRQAEIARLEEEYGQIYTGIA